jgi:hypothetical protein
MVESSNNFYSVSVRDSNPERFRSVSFFIKFMFYDRSNNFCSISVRESKPDPRLAVPVERSNNFYSITVRDSNPEFFHPLRASPLTRAKAKTIPYLIRKCYKIL